MKLPTRKIQVLASWLVSFSLFASCQIMVDATGPARTRTRNPTSGRSGSTGRKLPLRVAIERHAATLDEQGKTTVDFILTNTSNATLILPIWLHPVDLEPTDAPTSYAIDALRLFITVGKDGTRVLPGGTELYGNGQSSKTVAKLAPKESLRVKTRVAIPSTGSGEAMNEILVAHVVLDHQVVKTRNGETSEDDQELGYATSSEFTAMTMQAAHN
jgi:hypothetical protein